MCKFIFVLPLLIAMFISIKNIQAQIPVNDSAWVKQTSTSEEFNSAPNYTTKWNAEVGAGLGGEYKYAANLICSGTDTTLKIKADTITPSSSWVAVPNSRWHDPPDTVHYAYQSGIISSKDTSYRFGYLEISAKFPTSYYPLWPAFWLWYGNCSRTPTPQKINEIDIIENWAPDSYDGHIMRTDVHLYDSTGSCDEYDVTGASQAITNLPKLSDTFHKYAIQWAPDRILYYFDDSLVRTIYDASGATIPQYSMFVVLDLAIDPFEAFLPSDWNAVELLPHGDKTPTSFPQYLEVDYLRYYKLNATTTTCGTDFSICIPADYSVRAVEKSITTGGGVCTPNFNPSTAASSYTLRATDYVLLDAGTTINPSGSGYFAIETMACPK